MRKIYYSLLLSAIVNIVLALISIDLPGSLGSLNQVILVSISIPISYLFTTLIMSSKTLNFGLAAMYAISMTLVMIPTIRASMSEQGAVGSMLAILVTCAALAIIAIIFSVEIHTVKQKSGSN
jgi:hypothetical protein